MDQRHSELIVLVPEVEPLVGRLRAELDPSAALGVPAHVTVMFPFVPPAALDEGVVTAVGEIAAAQPAFDVVFSRVEWFGTGAVWLAPEPAAPFTALTQAVRHRFGIDPYEGAHGPHSVPHLTVGHRAPPARLRAAAAEVAAGLPVRARIRSLWLSTNSDVTGSWTPVTEFALPDHGPPGR